MQMEREVGAAMEGILPSVDLKREEFGPTLRSCHEAEDGNPVTTTAW
jgi:hypothetical protein